MPAAALTSTLPRAIVGSVGLRVVDPGVSVSAAPSPPATLVRSPERVQWEAAEEVLTMTQTVEAVYEDGVLRPLGPLKGIAEHCTVNVTVDTGERRPHPLADCIGTLPDEDAQEMLHIVADEFERVNPSEWQ